MQTQVSETSRAAFCSLVKEKKLQPMESKILVALKAGRAYTRKQLRDLTKMELSSVCGRVKSLLKAGLIEVQGEALDKHTGKRQELIGLPSAQGSLFT